MALSASEQLDEAEARLAAAMEQAPDDAWTAIEHGSIAMRRRDWREALDRWERVRRRFPNDASGYVEAGIALREMGRLDEAEAMLGAAMDRFPDNQWAAFHHALVAMVRRDWDEALNRWELVRERFPDEPAGFAETGLALCEKGQWSQAEAVLTTAMERFPDNPWVAIHHGSIAMRRRDWREALDRWERVRSRFPDEASGHVEAGLALREMGRLDEAEAMLGAAMDRFPDNQWAAIHHASVAMVRRDWDEALKRWEVVRERFPDEPAGFVETGLALCEKGQWSQAEAALIAAMERFPDYPWAAVHYGSIAMRRQQWDEAVRRWQRVRQDFPAEPLGYIEGGLALRGLRRFDEANRLFAEAAKLFPEDVRATCQGSVDRATRELIAGWAFDSANPNTAVALRLLDNGELLARAPANLFRRDLAAARIGTGRHAFEFTMPGGLDSAARHVIQVQRESDGADLPGSPIVFEPAGSFNTGLEQTVASAVEALDSKDAREHAATFLMEQADRVLQRLADAEGQRAERQTYQRFRRRLGADTDIAPPADPGRRALVVDSRLPALGRDAGSQAVLSHMRALRSLGYKVSFVAADEMARSAAAMDAFAEAEIDICGAPYYVSVEEVLRRQGDCFDVVYLHRADIASRYMALARRHSPKACILYSVADLHHVRLARQAEIEARPELRAASERMLVTESTAAWMADAVITHSEAEAAHLRRLVPRAKICVVPWEVPISAARRRFAQRHGIAFIGGYSHTPNADAAYWLVKDIMPLVWDEAPDVECLLSAAKCRIQCESWPGPASCRSDRWRISKRTSSIASA